jgi:hypothetical protein
MTINSIDNISISEQDPKVLMEFFTEDAFFKFMDHGRKGFTMVVDDMLDAFAVNIKARSNIETVKNRVVDQDTYAKMHNFATKELIDEFINNGSAGLKSAVRFILMMVNGELTAPTHL